MVIHFLPIFFYAAALNLFALRCRRPTLLAFALPLEKWRVLCTVGIVLIWRKRNRSVWSPIGFVPIEDLDLSRLFVSLLWEFWGDSSDTHLLLPTENHRSPLALSIQPHRTAHNIINIIRYSCTAVQHYDVQMMWSPDTLCSLSSINSKEQVALSAYQRE